MAATLTAPTGARISHSDGPLWRAGNGSRRSAIPAQPTPLLGRDALLQEAQHLLLRPDVRLVTLTGPGGVGKTRLAVQLAVALQAQFEHGVWFVDLSELRDPALVVPWILQTLGTWDGPEPPLERFLEALEAREMLLVLDTMEHVLSAAPSIAALLESCPRVRVLATSRARLHVRWEHVLPVPPLSHPGAAGCLTAVAGAPAGVALFLQRARAVVPNFTPTHEDKVAISEICARLDDLPLAIELAAESTAVLSPEEIAARLRERLDLPGTAASDVPMRHQSLRNMVGWSYSLLAPHLKALLTQVAVFEGGFTLDAAEAVATAVPPDEQVPALAGLIERYLLVREQRGPGEWRFCLLETVRTFAMEQLTLSGEADTVHRRHAAYYAGLAETTEDLLGGPAQARWLARLERESPNCFTALRWAVESGEAELGLRLGGALWRYWWIRGTGGVAEDLLEGLLYLSESVPPSARRAKGLLGAGVLAYLLDDYVAAQEAFQRSFATAKKVGERRLMAQALLNAGHAAYERGEYKVAEDWYEESRAYYIKEGMLAGQADALHGLSRVAQRQSDWDRASSLSRDALQLYRQLGDQSGMAHALHSLGQCAHHMANLAEAKALYEQSVTLFSAIGERSGRALGLTSLGQVVCEEGDYTRAHGHLGEALTAARGAGNRRQMAFTLTACAALAAAEEQPVRALRLAGAAATVLEAMGTPFLLAWRSAAAKPIEVAERLLGQDTAAAVFTLGRALSLEEAVNEALGAGASSGTLASTDEPVLASVASLTLVTVAEPTTVDRSRLTHREREIAALVAEGFTNRQVARKLVLSERTVDTHVEHILKKLKARSRAQIAAWVVQQEPVGLPTA